MKATYTVDNPSEKDKVVKLQVPKTLMIVFKDLFYSF